MIFALKFKFFFYQNLDFVLGSAGAASAQASALAQALNELDDDMKMKWLDETYTRHNPEKIAELPSMIEKHGVRKFCIAVAEKYQPIADTFVEFRRFQRNAEYAEDVKNRFPEGKKDPKAADRDVDDVAFYKPLILELWSKTAATRAAADGVQHIESYQPDNELRYQDLVERLNALSKEGGEGGRASETWSKGDIGSKLQEFYHTACVRHGVSPRDQEFHNLPPFIKRTAFYVAKLREIYETHDQKKIQHLPKLLSSHVGNEKFFYEQVCKKYSLPSVYYVPTGKPIDNVEKIYTDLICAIYQIHNPEKVSGLPKLFKKFHEREHELYEGICSKYKVTADETYSKFKPVPTEFRYYPGFEPNLEPQNGHTAPYVVNLYYHLCKEILTHKGDFEEIPALDAKFKKMAGSEHKVYQAVCKKHGFEVNGGLPKCAGQDGGNAAENGNENSANPNANNDSNSTSHLPQMNPTQCRNILQEFYRSVDPNRVNGVQALVKKYEHKEAALVEGAFKKYCAPEVSRPEFRDRAQAWDYVIRRYGLPKPANAFQDRPSRASISTQSQAPDWRSVLEKLFAKHTPQALEKIDEIVVTYKGQLSIFVKNFCSKYNENAASFVPNIDKIFKKENAKIRSDPLWVTMSQLPHFEVIYNIYQTSDQSKDQGSVEEKFEKYFGYLH